MTILDEIFAHKRAEVAQAEQARPLAGVRAAARQAPPPRDLVAALRNSPARPALIAEIKRASPSRGVLAAGLDPPRLARTYQQNGAAAISVLTDERFFRGHLDDLRAVRTQVDLPLLRKDFVFDPYQVVEARAAGADAVLLIVAMLDDEALHALHSLAGEMGMTALVEVHDEAELERALALRPRLVGINNRDLHTFQVDLETTLRLCAHIPRDVATVAESGIHTRGDVSRLAGVGVDAMLVGESLVVAEDTAARVRELARFRPRVKICGVTRLDDVLAAVDAGADMLGFNFYRPSPRCLAQADCARLVAAAKERNPAVTTVGVFVNAPLEQVTATLDGCGLDLAQLHGDEPPGHVEALGGRAFKAIRPPDLAAARADAQRYALHASTPALLVDAFRPGEYGGTGTVGDWTLARALTADYPLLLAGGLDAGNVAAALAQARPWGVDAASGVESAPGRKDHREMAAFVTAARSAAP